MYACWYVCYSVFYVMQIIITYRIVNYYVYNQHYLHTVELKIELLIKKHVITFIEKFKSVTLCRHKSLLTTVQIEPYRWPECAYDRWMHCACECSVIL